MGDEPSCLNQFHAKESRANQPGFVVFWPAVPVCFRITANQINPRYGVTAPMRRQTALHAGLACSFRRGTFTPHPTMPRATRDSCSLAYVIEQSGHSDIASSSDKVDYQTQPAVNEKDDSSRQYCDQIKDTNNSGFEARRRFYNPFHFSCVHVRFSLARANESSAQCESDRRLIAA